ncbi:transposase [uncultured Clostridium sp.]|uniref:IS110 family transposase n=1 Tax=uncultured Clostridium sp. TaxID=59620 RepID=UPI0025CCBD4F|nr:transposase [uncultured Clostridium sp.]
MQQNNFNPFGYKSKLDEKYLIIGIDVGKYNQFARFIDYQGNELGRKIVFTRDKEGLNTLIANSILLRHRYQKEKVSVAMEPTGIYCKNIYEPLHNMDKAIEAVLVNVNDVNNVGQKTDTIDSLAISLTAILKGYKVKRNLTYEQEELKKATSIRESLIKESVKLKNMITGMLDEFFPEYNKVYKGYFCKSSLILLQEIMCPEDVCNIDTDTLYINIKNISNTCISKKKLLLLEEVAKDNILIQRIAKIKGIGVISAANIISEIGDVNNFIIPKQIIAYAGLNLKIKESRIHKGKTRISKHGNAKLRAYLYRVILPLVKQNEDFKSYHNYLKSRKENPLKPLQSLVVLMCKLLKIIFGMNINNTDYNPAMAFGNTSLKAAS